MTRKIIGIPAYRSQDESSFGAGVNHLEFISKFGDARIIMPWEEFVEVDMLYLPGGMDVSPSSYGEVPRYKTSHTDVFKEFFMKERLPKYIESKTPIFGVCLGMQQLAVLFGSKLTQHLPFHAQSPDRWKLGHKVYGDTRFDRKLVKEFEVNSHHHQGVLFLDLSDDLICTYYSENQPDAAIVEAFKHNKLPIAGVQWHPEELYDKVSINIINGLLNNK